MLGEWVRLARHEACLLRTDETPAHGGAERGAGTVDQQGAEARLAEIAIFARCSKSLAQGLVCSSLSAAEQGRILGVTTAVSRACERRFPAKSGEFDLANSQPFCA